MTQGMLLTLTNERKSCTTPTSWLLSAKLGEVEGQPQESGSDVYVTYSPNIEAVLQRYSLVYQRWC